jgi:hypothetical protein
MRAKPLITVKLKQRSFVESDHKIFVCRHNTTGGTAPLLHLSNRLLLEDCYEQLVLSGEFVQLTLSRPTGRKKSSGHANSDDLRIDEKKFQLEEMSEV